MYLNLKLIKLAERVSGPYEVGLQREAGAESCQVAPANGSCTVTVDVTAPVSGNYLNTIAAGDLQTTNGANAAPAVATLTVLPGIDVGQDDY